MTEIGRQLRQQALHVGALSVPAHQARHGKGGPQVMQPRLVTSTVDTTHLGVFTHSLERVFGTGARGALALTRQEERRIGADRRKHAALRGIVAQHLRQIRSGRHDACLVELAVADA
jgi:hypothetical protein